MEQAVCPPCGFLKTRILRSVTGKKEPFINSYLLLVFFFCSRSGVCLRCCTSVNILGLKLTYSTAVLSRQPLAFYFAECEMEGKKG